MAGAPVASAPACPSFNVTCYGAADGFPVLALHGTPGSRLKFAACGPAAARAGLRLVSVDRWGYGRTGVPAHPSFQDFATEIGRLADSLGLGRFSLVAISGGGPFAAAVAAHLGPRVVRMALVSPLGPLRGLSRGDLRIMQRFCFSVLAHMPWVTRTAMRGFRAQLAHMPRLAIATALSASAPADRALLADPAVRDALVATFREALVHDVRGVEVDLRLFTSPWDFNLTAIGAPTRVWLGTEDRNVPRAAALRYGEDIAGATLRDLSGAGHFWIAANPSEVITWVADGGG